MIKYALIIGLLFPSLVRAQIIGTIAGNGVAGYAGDGGPAVASALYLPVAVALDVYGGVYVADFRNNVVRYIDKSGYIKTVAGNGSAGYGGDGGPATAAKLSTPRSIALDAAGNLFIADYANSVVRKVDGSGVITTVAGNGGFGFGGDGTPATNATLNYPSGVAVDHAGNLYIADFINSRVRKVDVSGNINTVAGNGATGYSGDLGPATNAALNYPMGVAIDTSGNLFIADYLNNCVRKVDASGIITTVAGNNIAGYTGDGSAATAAELNYPEGVAIDHSENLFIADVQNNVIRHVNSLGIISTIAGNDTAGFRGDGGLATAAELNNPTGIAVDDTGALYIADFANNRIREVASPAVIGALGVEQHVTSNNVVMLFPNPAVKSFTIEAVLNNFGNNIVSIEILNVLGQCIYSNNVFVNNGILSKEVTLNNIPNGVYFVRLKANAINLYSQLRIKN